MESSPCYSRAQSYPEAPSADSRGTEDGQGWRRAPPGQLRTTWKKEESRVIGGEESSNIHPGLYFKAVLSPGLTATSQNHKPFLWEKEKRIFPTWVWQLDLMPSGMTQNLPPDEGSAGCFQSDHIPFRWGCLVIAQFKLDFDSGTYKLF